MKCRETFRKCFASTLCVALVLGCCISQPDFLGPGISDAVAHATDRTDSTMDGEANANRSFTGSEWYFHPYGSVTIRNFYDNGYASQDANPSTNLDDSCLAVATAIQNLFGLDVSSTVPIGFTSYADYCSAGVTQPCPGTNNAPCLNFSLGDNETLNATSGHYLHHKSDKANLHYFYQQKHKGVNPNDIYVLTSGHTACGNRVGGTEHIYYNVSGLASSWDNTCITFGASRNNPQKTTTLHEITHCMAYSAGGYIGSVMDTEHGQCVMSYNMDWDLCFTYLETQNYKNIYCPKCRNEILNNYERFV